MSFSCGFFDAVNGDRSYQSSQFGDMFDGLINDGVYNNIGGILAVVPGTGVQVKVRSGKAWFNKTWSTNTTDFPINLKAPDLLLPRIDAIILEVDTRVSVRNNSLKVITGVPNVTPSKPTLIRADGLYQYPLAWVRVESNASNIAASKIENAVGKTPTPFVSGILASRPIDELWNQWEGEFQDWFADLKTQLEGDVAVNLQRQITLLQSNKLNVSAKATDGQMVTDPPTNDTNYVTPKKVSTFFTGKQATLTETVAGTVGTRWVSPAALKHKLETDVLPKPLKKVKLTGTVSVNHTWTVPTEARNRFAIVEMYGGSGGGGGGGYGSYRAGTDGEKTSGGAGGPGGTGGYAKFLVYLNSASYSYNIGAAGGGGLGVTSSTSSTTNCNGKTGGSTSMFGIICSGGEGGKVGNSAVTSGNSYHGVRGDPGKGGTVSVDGGADPLTKNVYFIYKIDGESGIVENGRFVDTGLKNVCIPSEKTSVGQATSDVSLSVPEIPVPALLTEQVGGKGGVGGPSATSSSAANGLAGGSGKIGGITIWY